MKNKQLNIMENCPCLSPCIEQSGPPSAEKIARLFGEMFLTAIYFFLIGLALTKIASSFRKNKRRKRELFEASLNSSNSSHEKEIDIVVQTIVQVAQISALSSGLEFQNKTLANTTRLRSSYSLNN